MILGTNIRIVVEEIGGVKYEIAEINSVRLFKLLLVYSVDCSNLQRFVGRFILLLGSRRSFGSLCFRVIQIWRY
ncbi:hypothetical protein ANOBCDAF_04417 [Pleomorphomonas sp. T1.2MG-36]|nr:hypothetical protein ANOBCDAF_04417 [Pleomorphomonas sp. T1.2MG-36]